MNFENEELIFRDIPPEDKEGLREKRSAIHNTEMFKTLQKIALPQRDNGEKFYVNERLDAIRERLEDSGYHEVYAGDLTSVWSKKPLEELSGIEMPGMITAHIDIVKGIKKPYADNILTSNIGLIMKGTYDNLICDAALVEVMRGGNVPDNVFFCFDGDEETGNCRGFKEASKWIEEQCGTKAAWAIATDVTDEGFFGENGNSDYKDHKDISIENLCGSWTFQNNFCLEFLKHKDVPKAIKSTEEAKEETAKEAENTEAAEQAENIETVEVVETESTEAEPTDIRRGAFGFVPRSTWNMPACMKDYYGGSIGECDEAWTIKDLGINGASLCIPIKGPMHSDKGCYARPESYLMFIDNLEMIGIMLSEMDRDKILGHDEQYDPPKSSYSYSGYGGSSYSYYDTDYSNYNRYRNYAYDAEEENEDDEFAEYVSTITDTIYEGYSCSDCRDLEENADALIMMIEEDWDYNYEQYPTWNTLQEKCEMYRDVVTGNINGASKKEYGLSRTERDSMIANVEAIPIPGSYEEDYNRNTGFHQMTLEEYSSGKSKPKAYIKKDVKLDPRKEIIRALDNYRADIIGEIGALGRKYSEVAHKICDADISDDYEDVFNIMKYKGLDGVAAAAELYKSIIIGNVQLALEKHLFDCISTEKQANIVVAAIKEVDIPGKSKEAYDFDNYEDVERYLKDEQERETAKQVVKTEVKPIKPFFNIDLAKFSSKAEKDMALEKLREINIAFKKGLVKEGYSKDEAKETMRNIKAQWKEDWKDIAKNIHTVEELSEEYIDFIRTNFLEKEDAATKAYQDEAREEMEYGEPDYE